MRRYRRKTVRDCLECFYVAKDIETPFGAGEGVNEMYSNKELLCQILHDMNDGVIVLDKQGNMLYCNKRAKYFLERKSDALEKSALRDQILNIAKKISPKSEKTISFRCADGSVLCLKLTAIVPEASSGETAVILSDVATSVRLKRKRIEATVVYSVLMICLCAYMFLWSFLQHLSIELPAWVMTQIVQGIAIIYFFTVFILNGCSFKDSGIGKPSFKKVILPDIIIAIIGCIVLVLGKVILLHIAPGFFPEGAPFWDWSVATPANFYYPLTVILQEFMAFVALCDNLRKSFSKRYPMMLSVVVSAAVFGALHIAYGLPYMLASFLMILLLGALYNKQKSIWGLCIIHYTLSEFATFLRYII